MPPDTVDKLRKMLAFLDDMEDPEELRMLPSWKAHTLTGDRKGTLSLSVTANRRLTFRIDGRRTRDLRRELRGLPLGRRRNYEAYEKPAPSWGFHSDRDYRSCRLTVTAAAIALRVSRPTLSSLLNGKADLSGDMALRIEKAFE